MCVDTANKLQTYLLSQALPGRWQYSANEQVDAQAEDVIMDAVREQVCMCRCVLGLDCTALKVLSTQAKENNLNCCIVSYFLDRKSVV